MSNAAKADQMTAGSGPRRFGRKVSETGKRKRRMLYIVSPGHSGSTLLTLLLATHPEVATIGERHYLIDRLARKEEPWNVCTCGKAVYDCEYLVGLYELGKKRLTWYQRGADFTRFRYSTNRRFHRIIWGLTWRSDFGRKRVPPARLMSAPYRRVLEANLAIIDRVLETQHGSVFLDGSKMTNDVIQLEKSGLFDITLIHLSRDGRGQFHSMLRSEPGITEERAAERFKVWHDRIRDLRKQWAGPIVRVKYEDLCEHPLEEIRRVVEKAGLDPDDVSLEFRSGAPHAIGNHKLVRSRSTKIVNPEAWKSALSAGQLATFERIAGDANRALGYFA